MSFASCHFESCLVKISANRSRVLSSPSRDSRSIAVISSSGVGVPGDFKTVDALATMRSCFNVDTTVTTRQLVEVRKNYFVPPEYELHAPLQGGRPYDAFLCGFSLSTDALEVGLSFLTKWTSRTVNNSMPALSADETELVEILRGILSASRGLDGARNDRARLEGDILSLSEVALFLEAESLKAVATYKVSRGFESGLEKMGRVSYEFGYRVALERL
ncbi:hypothetical protein BHE74_00025371 [Ensete ventricosum]|nr:hypothetical protein BHE74_00025371 [Ensete ventricosum]